MKDKALLILPIFNLILILLVLLDSFVFEPVSTNEIYDRTYSKRVASSRLGLQSHEEHYLKPVIGKDIYMPYNWISMANGDTFCLQKTLILRRNLNVVSRNEFIAVGLLNTPEIFMKLIFICTSLVSSYTIYNFRKITNPAYKIYFWAISLGFFLYALGNYFIHY